MTTAAKRSNALDALRAVAIILVLFQHQDGWLRQLHGIGWAGVDLFFVLSGYLVTTLLLKERLARGSVEAGRFLLRRGFKIYPSFWVMIVATVVLLRAWGMPLDRKALLCELVFLQNYGRSLWVSTWSLAVEEHFYFAVALLFLWLNRSPRTIDPRSAWRWCLACLLVVLSLRVASMFLVPPQYKLRYWGTHARIDGLAFGAFLAVMHAHAPAAYADFVSRHRWKLVLFGAVVLVPVWALGHDSMFVQTVGFTLTYLASGCFLSVALHADTDGGRIVRGMAAVGRYSYGIYLWHLPIRDLVLMPLSERQPGLAWLGRPEVYFATTIAGGVLLSRLVEVPFLNLRDRWVPSRGGRPAIPAHAEVS